MNDDDRGGELVQGTLEMLVLKTLALEPMHGWGIAHRIRRCRGEVFLVTQGSLYPALIRMKRRGWIGRRGGRPRTIAARATTSSRRRASGSSTWNTPTWQRASAAVNCDHRRPRASCRRAS